MAISVISGGDTYPRNTYLPFSNHVTDYSLPAGVYVASNDAKVSGSSSTGHIPCIMSDDYSRAVTVNYGSYYVSARATPIAFDSAGGPTNTSGSVTISLSDDSASAPYGFLKGLINLADQSQYVFSASLVSGSSVSISGDYLTSTGKMRGIIVPLRIRKYTVSFNANGGSGAPSSISVVHGGSWTCPSTLPTKDGATCKGWSTSSSATTPSYVAGRTYSNVTSNLTLYAVWAPNCGILVYNANGGTISPSYKSVLVGESYGTLPVPTRSGHSFVGWFTLPSGGTQVTSATTMPASGIAIIHAHWSSGQQSRTVHFNAMGGTVSETSRTVAEGDALGTLPTPSRTGYTFTGWFAPDGSQITSATVMGDDDIYAIATWRGVSLTITFNANGGTVSEATRTVAYGDQFGTLPLPSYAGMSFDGWFTEATGGTRKYATDVPTADVTLYAHWADGSVPWWSGTWTDL